MNVVVLVPVTGPVIVVVVVIVLVTLGFCVIAESVLVLVKDETMLEVALVELVLVTREVVDAETVVLTVTGVTVDVPSIAQLQEPMIAVEA